MATPVLTRAGMRRLAEVACGTVGAIPFQKMRLYVNDVYPGIDKKLGDLVECTLTGYVQQFPNGAAAVITDDLNQCLVTYPAVTFTFAAYAGPQVFIHGWYLCDSIASNLTGMRYFEPAIGIPLAGGTMVITLELPVRGG